MFKAQTLTTVMQGIFQHINSKFVKIEENKHLVDLGPQLGLIGLWAVIIYAIAFRTFRWE